MTEKEFLNHRWSVKTLIEYKHPRMDKPEVCGVSAVDFDEIILDLYLIDKLHPQPFSANIKHCEFHKQKKELRKV